LPKEEGISVQTWADVTNDGELVLDWDEVASYSRKFDRGYRTYDAALAKMISIIQKASYERGFREGLRSQNLGEQWLAQVAGNA